MMEPAPGRSLVLSLQTLSAFRWATLWLREYIINLQPHLSTLFLGAFWTARFHLDALRISTLPPPVSCQAEAVLELPRRNACALNDSGGSLQLRRKTWAKP